MKFNDKLITFSIIGVGLCLIGIGSFKLLNKPTPKTPTEPRFIAESKNENIQIKENNNKRIADAYVLNKHRFFRVDITALVPYGASEQIGLFNLIHGKAENWFRVTSTTDTLTGKAVNDPRNDDKSKIIRNCQTDNIQNSFEQTALGFRLQTNRNYQLAKQCYLFAAQKGNAYAANRLGELYLIGLGEKKDLVQAKLWLEKSANAGYYFAELNLGLMYLDTPLTSKTLDIDPILINKEKLQYMKLGANADLEKAKYWLSRARRQNSLEAKILMEHFHFQLDVSPIETQKIDIGIYSQKNSNTLLYKIQSENLPNRYPQTLDEIDKLSQIVLYKDNKGLVHFKYDKKTAKNPQLTPPEKTKIGANGAKIL